MDFEVVFTGALRDGFNRRRGIEMLASQFSLDFKQIKHLLSGARPVVKRVRERHQAERVVKALWNGGWHSQLHQGEQLLLCTSQTHGPGEPNAATGMIKQISADSSISLQMPETWQICDGLNPHALLQVGDRDAHHYAVVLKQARGELPERLDLAQYSAAQLNQCVAKVTAGDVSSERVPIEGATYPTLVSQMSAELNGVTIGYTIACLQWEQWFYTIFLWCENRDFTASEAVFLQVVQGFRVESSQVATGGRRLETELV